MCLKGLDDRSRRGGEEGEEEEEGEVIFI